MRTKTTIASVIVAVALVIAAAMVLALSLADQVQAATQGQLEAAKHLREAATRAALRGDFALADRLRAQADEIGGPPCTSCG